MFFRVVLWIVTSMAICSSCSQYRKVQLVRSGEVRVSLTMPEDELEKEVCVEEVDEGIVEVQSGEPFIMRAVQDEETGEMVAADILEASSVVARFRNVAERAGYVTIGFDVNVPAGMADSRFRLKLSPRMSMQEDTLNLDPIIITGSKYRERQLRGYERYNRFVESFITDTSDFIRKGQLELFLKRHFPDTYMMKNDSSLVSDPLAETLFGVTQEEALRHYTRTIMSHLNQRRMARRETMFRRYVKNPIITEGVRLDTVVNDDNGGFVYRYLHTFRPVPMLRKVAVSMNGSLYADGMSVVGFSSPDEMTFYISTLSSLIDSTPRFKTYVLERQAYEKAEAFIDFRAGSASVDTALGNNAAELRRIKEYISSVVDQNEYLLDSLVIKASSSPEGPWRYNAILSEKRSKTILNHVRQYVPEDLKECLTASYIPENWDLFKTMVENDMIMSEHDRLDIMRIVDGTEDMDLAERRMSRHPCYRYIKENIYPRLRSVTFDLHLHRVGMVKDTIYTAELDSLYMSGLEALRILDYDAAISLLGPYRDYNSALAYASVNRNHTALDILKEIDHSDPRVCYLMAVIYARLGCRDEALKYYTISQNIDPSFRHRAILDPELSDIL